MNIGIDIDGVLVDLYGWIKRRMKKYSKRLFGKRVYIKEGKHIYERYGLTREQDEEFWNIYRWDYSENVKTFKGIKRYFDRLRQNGHKLIIITARYHAGEDSVEGERMRSLIENSLKKSGLVYDKIIYTSEDNGKLKACKENNVDVMIDDSSWNILELENEVSCIIYDTQYNKWINSEKVFRARNWKEVYKIINQLSQKV